MAAFLPDLLAEGNLAACAAFWLRELHISCTLHGKSGGSQTQAQCSACRFAAASAAALCMVPHTEAHRTCLEQLVNPEP